MKKREIKYSDFPQIEEVEDPTLDILQSGRKISPSILSKYLNIGIDAARNRLRRLEDRGLCTSKKMITKNTNGKNQRMRVYFIKN